MRRALLVLVLGFLACSSPPPIDYDAGGSDAVADAAPGPETALLGVWTRSYPSMPIDRMPAQTTETWTFERNPMGLFAGRVVVHRFEGGGCITESASNNQRWLIDRDILIFRGTYPTSSRTYGCRDPSMNNTQGIVVQGGSNDRRYRYTLTATTFVQRDEVDGAEIATFHRP